MRSHNEACMSLCSFLICTTKINSLLHNSHRAKVFEAQKLLSAIAQTDNLMTPHTNSSNRKDNRSYNKILKSQTLWAGKARLTKLHARGKVPTERYSLKWILIQIHVLTNWLGWKTMLARQGKNPAVIRSYSCSWRRRKMCNMAIVITTAAKLLHINPCKLFLGRGKGKLVDFKAYT